MCRFNGTGGSLAFHLCMGAGPKMHCKHGFPWPQNTMFQYVRSGVSKILSRVQYDLRKELYIYNYIVYTCI